MLNTSGSLHNSHRQCVSKARDTQDVTMSSIVCLFKKFSRNFSNERETSNLHGVIIADDSHASMLVQDYASMNSCEQIGFNVFVFALAKSLRSSFILRAAHIRRVGNDDMVFRAEVVGHRQRLQHLLMRLCRNICPPTFFSRRMSSRSPRRSLPGGSASRSAWRP